jgi:hydroxymethylbilane synthase
MSKTKSDSSKSKGSAGKSKTPTRRSNKVKVGTRESKLARIQTALALAALSAEFPELDFEIIPITTGGDERQDRPIAELGSRGVFVKELEDALYEGRVDLVVHSLKDMPTEIPSGLWLAAVLDRADARDVLVSKNGARLQDLPEGARVATSSRRRTAQLKHIRPDLSFCDIRGNIQTRLRKLDEDQCDAMVLAAAGLIRLGLPQRISEYFDIHTCTPAAGQGALAMECRLNDERILALLAPIDDDPVRAAISAERAFLDGLGGGCSVPVGAFAEMKDDGSLRLTGCVAALDGSKILRHSMTGKPGECITLGGELVEHFYQKGAASILEGLKQSAPAAISPP